MPETGIKSPQHIIKLTHMVEPLEVFCSVVVNVGQFVLGRHEPAVVVARPVADDQVWTVGVVRREVTAWRIVTARAVQHGAAVVLEILGRLIAVRLAVVVLQRRAVPPVPGEEREC